MSLVAMPYALTADLDDVPVAHISERRSARPHFDVCIVGLGYVGLPTAISLTNQGRHVLGIDVSEARLGAIRAHDVDILESEQVDLASALSRDQLVLTQDLARLSEADTVLICVPTPIDHHLIPDLAILRRACDLVVSHARRGQTVILTSTTYVGTTRDFIEEPLRLRGLEPGVDVFVAFSPERIDPGNSTHPQHLVPRIVGASDEASAQRAQAVLKEIAPVVHLVSSTGAAEMTKLFENTFRAVNIALALEMSQAATALGLSIIEVIGAAATKPYGFMPFYPGPGVGGHCIPCDPHYLLWQLREQRIELPMIDRAMADIAGRPRVVVQRLRDLLADRGIAASGARVLLAGAAYKPGIRDTRESPAIEIVRQLQAMGITVNLWDPIATHLDLENGQVLTSLGAPQAADFDAVVIQTVHPDLDYTWLTAIPTVLDATYRLSTIQHRELV